MMAPTRRSPLLVLLGALLLFASQAIAVSAVLGVDLGTEYIKGALVKPGIPLEIVLTKDSRRKEASAVAFKPSQNGQAKDGSYPERLYGADALALAARFPGEVYPNLKTLLGLRLDDPLAAEYAARHPALKIQYSGERDTVAFKTSTLGEKEGPWTVEELLAMELQSLQKNAEVAAGGQTTVKSIVLTVPPFYTIEEKRAVRAAADLAGLKVLSLMSDGLAVGLNYATSRQFPNINEGAKPEYHMVFDIGAGSTKATVLKFQSRNVKDIGKFNKTVQEVQVLGSGWDRSLGGDALNYLIVDDMLKQFVDSTAAKKVPVTIEGVKKHGRAMAKLLKEAERLRHVLSANQNTLASFEGLYEDVDFKYKITRAEFETMAEAHVAHVGSAISDALKMAGLDIGDLDSVILHGGATRTPFVQKALEKVVGNADKIRSNVNSDEAAVFGAGFRAAELSPSFRVKEIRVSEGAMYPAGIKYTGGSKDKEQKQRLWTALSPMGAAAKELTLNEHADFSGSFYQTVGDVDIPIKAFSATNLTASVAEMKEKYSSCSDADITFKLGVRLNSETGEVEIAKAAIECEAEVSTKDSIIGGVKNLFGFGKKDEKKDGDKTGESESVSEGSEEVVKEEAGTSTSTGSETATSSGTAAAASGSAVADEPKTKKQLVSIHVKIELNAAGRPRPSKDEVAKSKDRLKAFATSDRSRILREEALNQLEGFTYKVRDLLDGESFIAKSTAEERSKLAELASAAGEWLYEGGVDATKDEFKAKLKQLQDIVNPVNARITEEEQRPALITGLKDALKQNTNFLDTIRDQIAKYDEWKASQSASSTETSTATAEAEKPTGEFEGLEDEADKPEEEGTDEKEAGPMAPLYKLEDLEVVDSLVQKTSDWLNELEPAQEALEATADPVLLVKDLKAKREQLETASRELAMKAIRGFEKTAKKKGGKKPKKESSKKKGDKKKAKSSATADAEEAQGTKPGELTQEQLAKIVEEAQREAAKADKKKAAEEDKHDEL